MALADLKIEHMISSVLEALLLVKYLANITHLRFEWRYPCPLCNGLYGRRSLYINHLALLSHALKHTTP